MTKNLYYGFKVVMKFRNKFYSVLSSGKRIAAGSRGVTRYIPGEFTEPRYDHGPLCVFDKLKHARSFARSQPWSVKKQNVCIWRCTYEPSGYDYVWRPAMIPDGVQVGSSFQETHDVMYASYMPPGKVLATRVKITSQVYPK